MEQKLFFFSCTSNMKSKTRTCVGNDFYCNLSEDITAIRYIE